MVEVHGLSFRLPFKRCVALGAFNLGHGAGVIHGV